MNTVRPLITITILIVACVLLYVQINRGPVRSLPGAVGAGQDPATEGVPPLGLPPLSGTAAGASNTSGTTSSSGASLAPQWPGTTVANTSADAGVGNAATPEVPAIPDLPPPVDGANTPTQTTVTPPVDLPADIPVARYPDDPSTGGAGDPLAGVGNGTSGLQAPGLGTAVASGETNGGGLGAASTATPAAQPSSTSVGSELDSAAENAMQAMGLTPQPAPPADNLNSGRYGSTPNVAAPAPAPAYDRYGLPITNSAAAGSDAIGSTPSGIETGANTAAENTPSASSFAAAWPAIQVALTRNELAQAHKLLSLWYGNPSLTPAEAEYTEKLLGQLAGTVIYSTEHRLEPPYVVRPGETLETIAQQHGVPWQLLAKINGIPTPNQVRPGQQLKVVRGPFSAVVDLRRSELALFVDGRYAGKFAVSVPQGASLDEGQWVVANTLNVPDQGKRQRSLIVTADSVDASRKSGFLLGAVPVELQRRNGFEIPGPVIGLSSADAAEVADILSVGSRVTIRR